MPIHPDLRVLYSPDVRRARKVIGASGEMSAPTASSLLLCLCSENAEIGNGTQRRTSRSQNEQSAAGACLRPIKPLWDVGVRIGAALRHAASTAPARAALEMVAADSGQCR